MAKKIETKGESDSKIEVRDSGIQVNTDSKQKIELPLVVVLPAGASSAQIEFAKVINGLAYVNPIQWNARKEELLSKLEALATAPDPIEAPITGAKVAVGTNVSQQN